MVSTQAVFDTSHDDIIHDAQMDYYGRRLATCSSDKTVRVFDVDGQSQRLLQVLTGHDGPVWQVSWAHPKFGSILASCSYDGRVLVWKETNGTWAVLKEHRAHEASVNSVAWAPHEFGLCLACASSDGKVSILSLKGDNQWESQVQLAHPIGANAVSWAPAVIPAGDTKPLKRFATGGCDNAVKIWSEQDNQWKEEETLTEHVDWVRDVAWAPVVGGVQLLASCSQDKRVFIYKKDSDAAKWDKKPLRKEPFADVVWRVSWSVTGTMLAVSSGDNKVSLWKESLDGEWENIADVDKN